MDQPSWDADAQTDAPSAGQRLESWKEIAAFLKRDVRTVQRWEKRDHLPVYRINGGQFGGVYAYATELDSWRDRARANGAAPAAERPVGHPRLLLWVAAATALLLLGGVAVWRSGPLTRGAVPGEPLVRKLAVFDWSFAQVSPDGRWLAYQDADSRRLWIRDLGTERSRLLAGDWNLSTFAWSPDSRHLAFMSVRATTCQLEIVDLDGTGRRVLWAGAYAAAPQPLGWMRDGKRIAAMINGATQKEIVLVGVDDGRIELLHTLPSQAWPAVSPDGRSLAYTSISAGRSDLFLVTTGGSGREIRITDGSARTAWPLWTADGRSLLFISERGGTARLAIVRTDPATAAPLGAPELLTPLARRSRLLSVTSAGEVLISQRTRASQVALLNADAPASLTSMAESAFPEDTFEPSWSADGRVLRFRMGELEGSTPVTVERNLATGDDRVIRAPASYAMWLTALSPDGTSLTFFGTDAGGRKGLYDYRPDTGAVVALWQPEPAVTYLNPPLSWSRDGSKLLFAESSANGLLVRVWRRGTTQPQTIAFAESRPFAQWSPSGREIAYTSGRCLMAVAEIRGTPRQIACAPIAAAATPTFDHLGIGSTAWSPDGRTLAWTVNNPEARSVDIWIVDYSTGTHVVWSGASGYRAWPRDLQWSPDGSQIAVTMDYKPQYDLLELSAAAHRDSTRGSDTLAALDPAVRR